uniref:FYVE-type domain-containing protein n=3 Tax=Clastoptera arizonana TaxID=38151 RepID=A0A1B6D8T1_9HEMI
MEMPEENSIQSKDNQSDENDVHLKLQKLSEQAQQHETEKQRMREEFGLQRAKMKELFIQKEEELKRGSTEHLRLLSEFKKLQTDLDEARSQAMVAKLEFEEERKKFTDELQSLQHVITETVLQTSRYEAELVDKQRANEKLEDEIIELKNEGTHKAPLLSAPGAMISTLTRKVVSQLGQSTNSNVHHNVENVEDSTKKSNRPIQDDEDIMKTLVHPLEEEIKALKEKLRTTDSLLRYYQNNEISNKKPSEAIVNLIDTSNDAEISQEDGSDSRLQKQDNKQDIIEVQAIIDTTDPEVLVKEVKRLQAELNDAQSHITVCKLNLEEERRKYNDEVKSLTRLISESVDESNHYRSMLEEQQRVNEKLEGDISELRGGSHETPLLGAPGVMISTFARKMAQLGQSDSSSSSVSHANSDNLEESMRKAQEDAEVLRSLVIPLEEEIKALKEKLRTADSQLRKYQSEDGSYVEMLEKNLTTAESSELAANNDLRRNSKDVAILSSQNKVPNSPLKYNEDSPGDLKTKCNLCLNYEAQLVNEQKKYSELCKELAMLDRCRQDLNKEMAIRKDMEQKWNENKEEHKAQVTELQMKFKKSEEALQTLQSDFKTMTTNATKKIEMLREQREQMRKDLQSLDLENEKLVGKHNTHSQELQDAFIDLPANVEELQEMLLKCREDLITARVGQEAAEVTAATQREESKMYVTQHDTERKSWNQKQAAMSAEISALQYELQKEMRLRSECQLKVQKSDAMEANLRSEMDDLKSQLVISNHDKKKLEEQVVELRNRVTSLQTELDNGETVQKDFVLLSQSLQQELERIRGADTQVRWEHDEDVDECPGCRATFSTVTRRKQHCRHCGRVFCTACLSHVVPSGPNQRSSKVCDVCHTLLNRNTAPYFSTEPPHSNE